MIRHFPLVAAVLAIATPPALAAGQSDALASWNNTAPKQAIIRLRRNGSRSKAVTGLRPAGRADRGLRQRRDAVGEQPLYFQFQFALDRVKALAPQHPEWKDHGARSSH